MNVLSALKPDAVLFVGDLGEADLRPAKLIRKIPFPTAVILGNHDKGNDKTGAALQAQLKLLGEIHCGWLRRNWLNIPLTVIGARPCSPGGGFYLSKEVVSVYGDLSIEESAARIVSASELAPIEFPLIILAHSGPTGLGSDANSLCGRDWKSPSLDWGDKDLALAIRILSKKRKPDLVVFGHMHHDLKRVNKVRNSFLEDSFGIKYLNAASVPRRLEDNEGDQLCHFSWVEFKKKKLIFAAHRWFRSDATLAYEDILFESNLD